MKNVLGEMESRWAIPYDIDLRPATQSRKRIQDLALQFNALPRNSCSGKLSTVLIESAQIDRFAEYYITPNFSAIPYYNDF